MGILFGTMEVAHAAGAGALFGGIAGAITGAMVGLVVDLRVQADLVEHCEPIE